MSEHLFNKIEISHLTSEHFHAAKKAICRIIRTDLSQQVLGQIVDGKPIRHALSNYLPYEATPWEEWNGWPRSDSVEVIKSLQSEFSPETLFADSRVRNNYIANPFRYILMLITFSKACSKIPRCRIKL